MIRIGRTLLLACTLGVCCGWTPVGLQLADHYAVMIGISRSSISPREKVEKLEVEYDRKFAVHRDALRSLNDGDLLAMFRSANMLASYTMFFHTEKNPRFLAAMEAAYREMRRRDLSPDAVASDMAGAYIAARRFADANRIIAANGDTELPMLPDSVAKDGFVEGRPGAFLVDAKSDLVRLANFDTTSGDVIVVVAGCHFSRDAAEEIAGTPSLRRAFGKARTLWLQPADRQFDLNQIQAWNREFPDQPMLVAYSHAPWRGVDFSEIPNFYFYRDGKLIAQHAGWKKGAPPQAVMSALRRMQLLD